jgi:ketosteroid isomerase-like protein
LSAHLDLVRAFFGGAPDDLAAAIEDPAWLAAAREGLAPLLAPDFEFVTVRESVGMPPTRTGVDGFFDAYRTYAEMWESYTLRPERLVEVGDKVVVEARISGTTRTGGVPLEQGVAAVYTFADGRIRRIEEFSDVASAHAAAAS